MSTYLYQGKHLKFDELPKAVQADLKKRNQDPDAAKRAAEKAAAAAATAKQKSD